jgi:uncharacterized protein YecT (DUF1311 family)
MKTSSNEDHRLILANGKRPRKLAPLLIAIVIVLFVPCFPYYASSEEEDHTVAKKIDPIDKKWEECIAKKPSTSGMNVCAKDALEAWDKALNEVFGRIVNRPDKNTKISLRSSQREWIRFRDAEFKFIDTYYDNFEGSTYSNMNNGDKIHFVRDRVLKLRSYLRLLDTK